MANGKSMPRYKALKERKENGVQKFFVVSRKEQGNGSLCPIIMHLGMFCRCLLELGRRSDAVGVQEFVGEHAAASSSENQCCTLAWWGLWGWMCTEPWWWSAPPGIGMPPSPKRGSCPGAVTGRIPDNVFSSVIIRAHRFI